MYPSRFPIALKVYKQVGSQMLLSSIHSLTVAFHKHNMSESRSLSKENRIENWKKPNFQKQQVL